MIKQHLILLQRHPVLKVRVVNFFLMTLFDIVMLKCSWKRPTRLAHITQTKRCSSQICNWTINILGETDECWLQLEDTGYSKLTNCNYLEWTIFVETATLFGHSPPTNCSLAGQRMKISINLIKENNLLYIQIARHPSLNKRKDLINFLHVRLKIRLFVYIESVVSK